MILDEFSLHGKVAIITGAGRGIGHGITVAFAEAGADIVCCARTADQIEATAAQARTFGRKALAMAGDVTDTQQVDRIVNRALEEFGRIDVLVNNAGGATFCPAMKTSERRWEAVIRLNLTAAFFFTKAVAAHMLERKSGSIINISSGDSRLPAPGMVAYAAAKAGINSMTKTMAWELGPHVRVNCILPGAIETEGSMPALAPVIGKLVAGTPRRRMGTPRDIALAAIFLASPAADFITGKKFEVDGGMEFVDLDPSEVGGSK
jgi:7-alpha-hydroxysteroid dehydrogenase